MNRTVTKLAVGQPYPFPLPSEDGAVAEFFRGSASRLVVAVSDLTRDEIHVLRKGAVYCGILKEGTAIMLLWEFRSKGRPMFQFDTPFDVRLIPRSELELVDKTEDKLRLMVNVEIVDRATGIVRGIRGITMPLAVSDALLSATMDQLAEPEMLQAASEQHSRWHRTPLDALFRMTELEKMGE